MKDFLECGKVVSTHGVHGEVKAEVWMDHPEEMTALKRVYLDGGKTPLTVKSARVHKNAVLLTLQAVSTPRQRAASAITSPPSARRGRWHCSSWRA